MDEGETTERTAITGLTGQQMIAEPTAPPELLSDPGTPADPVAPTDPVPRGGELHPLGGPDCHTEPRTQAR